MNSGDAHRILSEILLLPLEEQAVKSLRYLGKRAHNVTQCHTDAQAAREILAGRSVSKYLIEEGITVVISGERADFGAACVRARLDMTAKRISLYAEPLETLREACAFFALTPPVALSEIITAHETFHVMKPMCPEARAEVSAHFFATLHLELPWYAGVLDIAQILFKRHFGA